MTSAGACADRHRHERGQATVEFALLLPLICVMLLFVVQVYVVAQRLIVLQHAVREAARACAVQSCDAASIVQRYAGPSAEVSVATGTDVSVAASVAVPIIIPILSAVRSNVTIQADATMRVEGAPE
jgi:Flp pilus assembly protein TadG